MSRRTCKNSLTSPERLEERSMMDGTDVLSAGAYTSSQIAGMTADQVTNLLQDLTQQKEIDQKQLDDLGPQIDAANNALQTASDHMKAADDALNKANDAVMHDQSVYTAATAHVEQAKNALLAADDALSSLPRLLSEDRMELQRAYAEFSEIWTQLWHTPKSSQQYRDTLASMQKLENTYVSIVRKYIADLRSQPVLQSADKQARQSLEEAESEQENDDAILQLSFTKQADAKNEDGAAHSDDALKQKAVDALMAMQSDTQGNLDEVINTLASAQARQRELQNEAAKEQQQERQAQNVAALASSFSDVMSQTLDAEENKIGYAKMYVSCSSQNGATTFTVQFRNAGSKTAIDVYHLADGGYKEHLRWTTVDRPTADGAWQFGISQGDGSANGPLLFVARDVDSGKIIDEISGHYDAYNNTAGIDTPQMLFSYDQPGMLSDSPVAPALKLIETKGPNMLIAVQTPADDIMVSTDAGGFLSSADVHCPGGTTFDPVRITINAGRNSGDYQLQLFSMQNHLPMAVLNYHWDQGSQTITCADCDRYSGDQSTADGRELFENMLSVTSDYMGDVQINRIEQTRLYWDTANLLSPYNFYVDGGDGLMNHIFTLHPEYRPENWEAAIDAVWDQMGHTFTRGQAEDRFQNGRLDYIAMMQQDLNVYEEAMSDIMQTAVDGIIQILHGASQGSQFDRVQACIDRWTNKQQLAVYQSDAMHIGQLSSIGITIPSCGAVMEAAKRLYVNEYQQIIQADNDVTALRNHETMMRDAGLRETAEGQWVAASGNTVTPLPPDMDPHQIRLAAKILTTLQTSNDPRVVALRDVRKQELAIGVAQITQTVPDPTAQKQALDQLADDTAQKSLVDDYVAAHQDDIQAAVASVGSEKGLSADEETVIAQCINQKTELLTSSGFNIADTSTFISAVANFIEGAFTVPTAQASGTPTLHDEFVTSQQWFDASKDVPDFFVRQDTPVGKIFLGLLQKTEGVTDVMTFVDYAKNIQDITAIPWYKVVYALEISGPGAQAANLKNLFEIAGYGELFANNTPYDTPEILTVAPYKTEYDANETIQVRFDMSIPSGYEFDHAFAYAIFDGQQLSDTPISIELDDQMYARIPVSAIQSQILFSHDGPVPIQIKIAGWFKQDSAVASLPLATAGALSEEISIPAVTEINPFISENLSLSDTLTGTSFGVNWDDRSITDSCVFTARAIVDHFKDFYGGATIPKIADTSDEFTGAARLMMDVSRKDKDGNIVIDKEKDTPGFSKIYLRNLPDGSLPPIGAVLVWNTSIAGGAGHVAIVVSNKDGNVEVIDGNWAHEDIVINGEKVHNGFGSIHLITDFSQVIGWLVPDHH